MEIEVLALGGGVAAFGLAMGVWMGRKLARRSSSFMDQFALGGGTESVLKSAEKRREYILDEARRAAKEQFEEQRVRIEEEAAVVLELQEDCEKELNERQSELDRKTNELSAKESALVERQTEVTSLWGKSLERKADLEPLQEQLKEKLVGRTSIDLAEWQENTREMILSSEKLGISKWLIENAEDLKIQAKRLGKSSLSNVYLRYNPTFVWPKVPFSVESSNMGVVERNFSEGSASGWHRVDPGNHEASRRWGRQNHLHRESGGRRGGRQRGFAPHPRRDFDQGHSQPRQGPSHPQPSTQEC